MYALTTNGTRGWHGVGRLRAHNRFAANLVPLMAGGPLSGPRWGQRACHGSEALARADGMAQWVAEQYEARARATFDQTVERPHESVVDAGAVPGLWSDRVVLQRGARRLSAGQPVAQRPRAGLRPRAQLAGGTWARNPSLGEGGYSIPLPKRVGKSQRFFPDFVWWIDGRAWVFDTTADFLMAAKMAANSSPSTPRESPSSHRGRLDERWNRLDDEGWTLVVRGADGEVRVDHYAGLVDLCAHIRLLP